MTLILNLTLFKPTKTKYIKGQDDMLICVILAMTEDEEED